MKNFTEYCEAFFKPIDCSVFLTSAILLPSSNDCCQMIGLFNSAKVQPAKKGKKPTYGSLHYGKANTKSIKPLPVLAFSENNL